MPYFPAYIDLSDKEVLVIGGGKVATRKVLNLLKFTDNITVVSPKVSDEIRKLWKERKIKLKRRKFLVGDLKDKDMVIVAVDDLNLQKKVFQLCEKKRILCNSVDSPDFCNFIFPSLIVKGELVIGISTSGKVPALSKRVRELIENCLPQNLEEVLKIIQEERRKLPKGRHRQERIIKLVEELI